MALTRNLVVEEIIPHEPGEWMRLRRLSGTQLDEAKRAKARKGLREMAEDGDAFKLIAEVNKITADAQAANPAAALKVPPDPLAEYDRLTLLEFGIVGWSYDEEVSPETIADLDEETMDWAARKLLPKQKTADERLDFTSGSPDS